MQRFKLIFHIIYVLITLTVMYFSVDILLNTEAYLSKIKLSAYIKFPRYIMGVFLFISILMIIEFALRVITVQRVKGQMSDLENQVLELKAKLYDQGQGEISEGGDAEADESVSEEEEESEEDT